MRYCSLTVLSCSLGVFVCEAVRLRPKPHHGKQLSPLPQLSIGAGDISVSGVSAGGDFGVQFQVAYSSLLRGSAIVAGQPYHCALTFFEGETGDKPPYDHCKNRGKFKPMAAVNVSELVAYAKAEAAKGEIDDLKHLRTARIYLFEGTKDKLYRGNAKLVEEFFSHFLHSARTQMKVESAGCPHAWPTLSKKGFGFHACKYDGAAEALSHIYGVLKPPAEPNVTSLRKYDQAPFQDGDLAPEGYIYIPSTCESGRTCSLHLNFHGCGPWLPYQIDDIGFNRWAETNDIVVVYPLRNGCWDGYGNTGPDYALKTGLHMATVRKIIQSFSGI